MLTLTSLNGQEKGREFQLTGEAPELLGRQAPTIQLADAQTSRKHAEILLENNTWLIRDLDSTNGTWVNGQKITQITELEVGDRIVIGRHQFRVSGISDLPAPSPKPLPIPAAPLIGDEELGEMGVDLNESLSADILDDDALELPDIPDSAIVDEDEGASAEAAPVAEKPQEPDDGVIDLDALLDGDEARGHSHGTAAHAEPEADDDEPPAPSSGGDQGVIDIDDLLGDQSGEDDLDMSAASAVEAEAPAEPEGEADAPVELDEPLEAPAAAEPTTSDDNVDFDLDELLSEELAEAPSADEPGEDILDDVTTPDVETPEETTDEPAEAVVDEVVDESAPLADSADDEESDSIEDIDAMLEGLGTQEDTADEDNVLASAVPPVVEPSEPEVDVEGSTDDDQAADEPGDESEDESDEQASADGPDSLIDIDILAAATPAVPLGSESDEAEPLTTDALSEDVGEAEDVTEEAEESQSLDESGVFSDDSAILDAGDTGLGLDDSHGPDPNDSIGELHDTNQATGLGEAEADEVSKDDEAEDTTDQAEDGPLASDEDDDKPLEQTERELLLTEQEQAKAVTGYKRSKLVTLSVIVLISAVVGFGGWYAVDHFTNHADANDQHSDSAPADSATGSADPGVSNTGGQPTDPPKAGAGRVPIPDLPDKEPQTGSATNKPAQDAPTQRPRGYVPIPDLPDKPDTSDAQDSPGNVDASDAIGAEAAPDTPLPPTDDEPSDAGPTDEAQAPDPFEDVDTPVFDDAPGNSTHGNTPSGQNETSSANPPVESPDAEPVNQADTAETEAVAQAGLILDPIQPAEEADPPIASDSAPEPVSPQADTTVGTESVQAQVEPIPVEPIAPDTGETGTESGEAELNILAGVIESQNKPGVGVNEQAALAGARRIVYLVDASGSLVDSFPRVLNELNLSIDRLEEDQAFTAIFFGAEGVTEVPPVGLKWADPQTKRNARNWIDPDSGNVTAWGRGDLMEALQRATGYGADEIVILSDNLIGSRPSQQKIETLIDDITQVTEGKIEKINVMQFFSRDPKHVLKTIAERFNGSYSLILAGAESSSSAEHPGEDPVVYP